MGMLGVVFGRVNLEVEAEGEGEGEDEVDMVLLRHRAGRWDVAFGGGVRHWDRRRSLESIRVQVWCIPRYDSFE
jgi:hypothetical protein